MIKVPIIRNRIYKKYLSNGIFGGFLIGLLWFLLLLRQSSFLTSLCVGLGFWFGVTIVFMVFGFFGQEYFSKKNKIRILSTNKYEFLRQSNFRLYEELFFEGVYENYFIRVFLTKEKLNKKDKGYYDIINVYYKNDSFTEKELVEKENALSGDYFLGSLRFESQVLGFIPKDWQKPCFKENFDGAINILKRQQLYPTSNEEWENTVGKRLETDSERIEREKFEKKYKLADL